MVKKLIVLLVGLCLSILVFAHVISGPSKTTLTFGPTKVCDNLWQIAKLVSQKRPVNPYQVAVAIWKTNKEAFYTGNMNGLRSGFVLKIPAVMVMKRYSAKQASKIMRHEEILWKKINNSARSKKNSRTIHCSLKHIQNMPKRLHVLPMGYPKEIVVNHPKTGYYKIANH